MSVKVRLGIMMFLQYAVWGSWAPVLAAYLQNELGFSGVQVGVIYSLLPLATIISPFIGGQIADRYFSSEKVISALQLCGGVLLLFISRITDYSTMMWLMTLYCLLYAPNISPYKFNSIYKSERFRKRFWSDQGLGNNRMDSCRMGFNRLEGLVQNS